MDANLLLKPEQVDVDIPPSWKCNLILIIYFCNYVSHYLSLWTIDSANIGVQFMTRDWCNTTRRIFICISFIYILVQSLKNSYYT